MDILNCYFSYILICHFLYIVSSRLHITVNRLVELIMEYGKGNSAIEYTGKRAGDVLHSLADIGSASAVLGYAPSVGIEEGLRSYIDWARGEVSL
jgi:nucleoside-diphosphate-sugar epimerase